MGQLIEISFRSKSIGMDAEYLKENVGDALTAALTSLAIKQPKDSLGFIGQYLINYADYLEAEGKVGYVIICLLTFSEML